MLEISINDMIFRLLNVYAQIWTRRPFLWTQYTDPRRSTGLHIHCGDLNLTLNTDMDSCNYKHVNNPQSC